MFGRKKKKRLEEERRNAAAAKLQQEKAKAPVKKEEEKPKKEPVVDAPKKEEKPKERKMSYHITKHPQGGWQIKKGKAERALKRFKTQKEAIDYAKDLEKNGASFIIHKADGSTRKKTY